MNLYFIDRIDTIKSLNNEELLQLNNHLFALRIFPVIEYAQSRNWSYVSFEKQITIKESREIENSVRLFLDNWYRNNDKDLSVYKGISLGYIMEGSLIFPVTKIFKYTFVFIKLLNCKPENIYYDYNPGSVEEFILKALTNKFGINCYRFGTNMDEVSPYE